MKATARATPALSLPAARVLALAGVLAAPLAAGCSSAPKEVEELHAKEAKDRISAATTLSEKVAAKDEDYEPHRQEIAAALRRLLDDPSALVRQVAIDAIAKVEGGAAAPAIADRLRDQDAWVRLAAVRALGDLGAQGSVEAIAARLRQDGPDAEENPDVRRTAAQALAKLKNDKALRDLYGALSDRVPAVRYNAYLALKAITGEDFGEDPKAWRARALGGHGD